MNNRRSMPNETVGLDTVLDPSAPPLVHFIANLAAITSMLEAGFTIRHVWQTMVQQQKTTYCYEQFRTRVRRHIRRPDVGEVTSHIKPPCRTEDRFALQNRNATGGPTAAPAPSKFVITRHPKAEDLL